MSLHSATDGLDASDSIKGKDVLFAAAFRQVLRPVKGKMCFIMGNKSDEA